MVILSCGMAVSYHLPAILIVKLSTQPNQGKWCCFKNIPTFYLIYPQILLSGFGLVWLGKVQGCCWWWSYHSFSLLNFLFRDFSTFPFLLLLMMISLVCRAKVTLSRQEANRMVGYMIMLMILETIQGKRAYFFALSINASLLY